MIAPLSCVAHLSATSSMYLGTVGGERFSDYEADARPTPETCNAAMEIKNRRVLRVCCQGHRGMDEQLS